MRNANFFKTILTAGLLLLFVASAVAFEGIKLVPGTTEKTFTLYVGNLSTHELSVKIYDQYNVSVFTQNIEAAPNYSKRYNLDALPAGHYAVQVSTPTRIQRHSILITDEGLVLATEKPQIDFKPVIQLNGTQLDINLLSQGKSVKLIILNKDNELVSNLDLGNPVKIHQRLELKKLDLKEFTLKIRCGDRTFYENLSL